MPDHEALLEFHGKMKKTEKVNTINAWLACTLRIPQDTTE